MTHRWLSLLSFGVACLGCGDLAAQRAPSPEAAWPEAGVPEAKLAPQPDRQPALVSMVQLIGNPGQFDGQQVSVIGYAQLDFESHGLYLHREDFEQMLLPNSLSVDVPRDAEFTRLNGRYVIVSGVFKAWKPGGLRAGSLVDVSRYDPVPSRAQLDKQRKRDAPSR